MGNYLQYFGIMKIGEEEVFRRVDIIVVSKNIWAACVFAWTGCKPLFLIRILTISRTLKSNATLQILQPPFSSELLDILRIKKDIISHTMGCEMCTGRLF